MLMLILGIATVAQTDEDPMAKYAEPEEPGLPPSNMVLDLPRTAIVITDPQIDFLSPDGVTWGLVGKPGFVRRGSMRITLTHSQVRTAP